jgi:Family of unknown function (DUF5946)
MISETETCPECGAVLADGQTCRDHFEQMLYWEAEEASRGVVHHLMVLCYHLQHPHLYSPETLAGAQVMLADFLENGVTPHMMRRKMRDTVDSGKRTYKITGDKVPGAYDRAIPWTMTAADVVASGADRYSESVEAWARSMLAALRACKAAYNC